MEIEPARVMPETVQDLADAFKTPWLVWQIVIAPFAVVMSRFDSFLPMVFLSRSGYLSMKYQSKCWLTASQESDLRFYHGSWGGLLLGCFESSAIFAEHYRGCHRWFGGLFSHVDGAGFVSVENNYDRRYR